MQILDDITAFAWSMRRKGLEAFLLPAAGLAEGRILARDSSLVSLIELDGALSATGEEELQHFVTIALARWNTEMLDPGHALHVTFERDPTSPSVGHFTERQEAASRHHGLDLGDVLREREQRLADLVADESITLACWTRPSSLTRDQERRDRRALRRRLKDWLPRPSEAQCPQATYESLEPRHAAFLASVESALQAAGIAWRRLDTGPALAAIRRMTSGGTDDRHLPVTTEEPAPAHLTEPAWNGAHHPPLAPQLIVDEPARNGPWIEIGARRYAAIDMLHGPRSARPFGEFAAALAAAGIPCRWSLLIEGGGLSTLDAAARRIASAFLAFSSADSRASRDALNSLAELRQQSRAVVRLRLSLLTWTGIDADPSDTARHAARAQQVLEGWGECVATRLGWGDPLETLAASVPGFACGGTAEPALAPLEEALTMLPVSRPAAFDLARPNHLFRSPDGRMLPFSFETAEDYGLDLIYGIPGRGKSVLLNALALAWCLQSGHADLPLVAVIDIGPSSTGLISLLREALPDGRRHEAAAFRLTMAPECAINPFDTQLGCRRPLPAERQYLANLLALILTPAGAAGVPDGAREAIGAMIDAAYAMRSDGTAGGEPALYTPRRDARVDEALEIAAVTIPERATWWEVVDLLFAAGQAQAAARAQRYAVPVLSDIAAAIREASVQALIGRATWGTGSESVTDAVIRILAATADTWPIFFHPTTFDTRRRPGCGDRSRRSRADGQPGGGAADGRHLHAGPPCPDPPLVDRPGGGRGDPARLSGVAPAAPDDGEGGAQAAHLRRVPSCRRGPGRAGAGRARHPRGPQAAGHPGAGLPAPRGLHGTPGRARHAHLGPGRRRQEKRDRGADETLRPLEDPRDGDRHRTHRPARRRRPGAADRDDAARADRAGCGQQSRSRGAVGPHDGAAGRGVEEPPLRHAAAGGSAPPPGAPVSDGHRPTPHHQHHHR